ncbi:hypothetical protein [Rurimicrobium arvi]|uniref:Uncharacterized protein n=1 Tax=Rurimicrobium arvi TaxID=2049916 RepID=A0ABP8MXW8_9BACT
MIAEQKMACPSCNSDIFFSIPLLIAGASFTCTHCSAHVKLAGSSAPDVKASYDKYLELKKNALAKN